MEKVLLEDVESMLRSCADQDVESKAKFFKSYPGGYGEGDRFLGVTVPNQRLVSKEIYQLISIDEWSKIMKSPYHEMRLVALFVLVKWYEKAKNNQSRKRQILDLYLQHIPWINNWDLVDSSSYKILGPFVEETQDWELLFSLSKSDDMWKKRIAVVSLHHLFKNGYVQKGLELLHQNIEHEHDLMHKANGWMLKILSEVDYENFIQYLKKNFSIIPRTTLRYAIEILDEKPRKEILSGTFDVVN